MSEMNGNEPCGYIADGYTQVATIEAESGVHPALQIEFRPMLGLDRSRAIDRMGEKLAENLETAYKAVLPQVVSWDLRGPDGEKVPVSADTLPKVEPHLFVKIRDHVYNLLPENKLVEEKAKN